MTDPSVRDLLKLPDHQFKEFVETEMFRTQGGRHRSSIRALLGSEELADRWREVLLEIKHEFVATAEEARYTSPETREALDHVRGLIIELATVRSLLSFTDDDFQDVVDGEVRRVGGKYLKSLLADPTLIDRWRLALVQMKKNVESQMGARGDDMKVLFIDIENPERTEEETCLPAEAVREARIERHRAANADFVKWRAGAKRFKLGVEERLLEIRRTKIMTGAFRADDHVIALHVIQTLVDGIEAHRAQMVLDVADEDISDADKELWRLLPTSA